ncbi:hypothetical protein CHLRE_13g565083v5 [Chlamydomonas reinhardtii]|uniref:Uncharacterized protein n=1 Tax=Chlamydomonas reinhardtii TaxID=3055 RepID=A0A2K3CZ83_CHLRE|nr:uncharacterized protein CHLRE_13g565083v5 [Chlamydomonas reinhardtii]PNW73588.1 hypothetical protein CHLRE_13g565083v5 [Chlamydomonas reinhardtii]
MDRTNPAISNPADTASTHPHTAVAEMAPLPSPAGAAPAAPVPAACPGGAVSGRGDITAGHGGGTAAALGQLPSRGPSQSGGGGGGCGGGGQLLPSRGPSQSGLPPSPALSPRRQQWSFEEHQAAIDAALPLSPGRSNAGRAAVARSVGCGLPGMLSGCTPDAEMDEPALEEIMDECEFRAART